MCDMEAPNCNYDLIPAIQNGCYECVQTDTCEPLCTDLNGDGSFNVVDIVNLVQIVLGTTPMPEDSCDPDYNDDGAINIQDIITSVLLLLAG